MTEEKIILMDDPEAAQFKTVTGWVSRNGRFFGDFAGSERAARYDGATHSLCQECKKPTVKSYMVCLDCRAKKDVEKYWNREAKDWDGEALLYSETRDEYYNDLDDAECDIEVSQTLDDLRLRICEPIKARKIDEDHYTDDTPEGGELPAELDEAITEFNEKIKDIVVSWQPGKYRLKTEDEQ